MNKSLARLLLFATLSGCAATPGGAAGTSGGATSPSQIAAAAEQTCVQPDSAPAEFAKQPGYQQIVVWAQARNGGSPAKLSGADLRLYHGSKEVPIQFFQQQAATVGILVDTSGSMEPKLPPVRASLADFIRALDRKDDVFLAAFSDRFVYWRLLRPTTIS